MPLDAATKAKAKEELHEPDDTAPGLAVLRSKFAEAVGAEEAERFEWALLATLRQAKWDQAKALDKMNALHKFSRKHAELFDNLTPDEFLGQAAIGVTSHLPTRNDRGELVLLVHGQAMSALARKHTMRDLLRYSVFYMRELMTDEQTQVNGVIIVENLKNYPMTALNKMSGAGLSGMRASFDWLGVSPMRLRGIYGCHQPWYVGLMLGLVKPFMSKKLRERVRLYGSNVSDMLQAAGLRPEDVPELYGGTLQGWEPDWHLKQLIAHRS